MNIADIVVTPPLAGGLGVGGGAVRVWDSGGEPPLAPTGCRGRDRGPTGEAGGVGLFPSPVRGGARPRLLRGRRF